MNERAHPTPDTDRSSEAGKNPGEFAGMQVRLLLGGDLLNPEKKTENPIDDSLFSDQKTLEQRANTTYRYLEIASQNERRSYWKNQPVRGFTQQKRQWAENTAKTFNASRDFFQNSQQGQEWSTLFTQLGINAINATAENAEQFYSAFLAKQDGNTLQGFVASFLRAHVENNRLDFAKLQKNLPAIQWLSHMFGKNSSEVITQLIDAEVRIQNDQQAPLLIEQVNTGERINRLTVQEERLLSFVWGGRVNSEETATETVETEKDNTETPEEIAGKLINYETGEVTDEKVDLLPSFSELVEDVTHLVESKRLPADGPVMILSDVAWAMMDKIASSSNSKNKELGFAIQGATLFRNSAGELVDDPAEADITKNIHIGAFTAPTMDYKNSMETVTRIDQTVYHKTSAELAENTGLSAYLKKKTGYIEGYPVSSSHTHQESLGKDNWIKPSGQDYSQSEQNASSSPTKDTYWAVVTKARGKLMINLIRTSIDRDGKVVHQDKIPCLPESELYQRLKQAA